MMRFDKGSRARVMESICLQASPADLQDLARGLADRAEGRLLELRRRRASPSLIAAFEARDAAAQAMLRLMISRAHLNAPTRCGAQTRTGSPCKALAVRGRRRCRNHGGLSTGPQTAEGWKRTRDGWARWRAERIEKRSLTVDESVGGQAPNAHRAQLTESFQSKRR